MTSFGLPFAFEANLLLCADRQSGSARGWRGLADSSSRFHPRPAASGVFSVSRPARRRNAEVLPPTTDVQEGSRQF